MTDPTPVVDRYIDMWNEVDPSRRRQLIDALWTPSASYVDPLMRGDGPAGIDAMVAAVQQRFPRHRFRRTGPVDAHNGHVRFAWELAEEGAEPLVAGIDFGRLAEDGRLEAVTGFLDRAPSL
jgi:hypothetical protein